MTTISHYMPAAEYHALDSLSSSRLKVARESIWLYNSRFVAKTMPEPESSESQLLGSVTHDLLLMSLDSFDKSWFVVSKVDRRTKAGKEAWNEFREKAAGKTLIPHDTYTAAWRIAENIGGNETAHKLLGMGLDKQWNEVVIQWHEEKYGLDCRARIDRIVTPELVVDVKTMSGPINERRWSMQMYQLGYHNQAAWYCRACEVAFGKKPKFVFIVGQSEEPWEVGLYECPIRALELGESNNVREVEKIVSCQQTGDWREERSKSILAVDLPAWAYRDEWSFA